MEQPEFHATNIQLEAARLLTRAREKKRLSKQKLAEQMGIDRRAIIDIEYAKRSVDLVLLDKILTACGETLMLRLSSRPGRKSLNTAIEDEILNDFAAGNPALAEEKLKKIRTWHYPMNQCLARCKRDTAIALSYHFQGKQARGASYMNNTIMGLSLARFTQEAQQFIELYQRIVREGDEQLSVKNHTKHQPK